MPILGIDEVGRGPWAGPLVVGAVILKSPETSKDFLLAAEDSIAETSQPLIPIWDSLTDSKKLTKSRREELAPQIKKLSFATGLGWVSAKELDEIGLAAALRTAARRAVADCLKNAGTKNPEQYVGGNQNIKFPSDFPADEIIIDGTANFLRGTPLEDRVTILKKADLLVKEVSAASIIAKVARDQYMIQNVAEKYPEYGFEKHVGYGTAAHQKALETYGPCPEHRATFRPVAKVLENNQTKNTGQKNATKNSASLASPKNDTKNESTPKKNTTKTGQHAEKIVAEYLEAKGHKILAKNYKTKTYEIDLISATKNHIYFTEVKYRKTKTHGTPLESITKKKRTQMTFAAESFMEYLRKSLGRSPESLPSPILAAAAVSGADYEIETWLPLD